jgi:hypothetical protein
MPQAVIATASSNSRMGVMRVTSLGFMNAR